MDPELQLGGVCLFWFCEGPRRGRVRLTCLLSIIHPHLIASRRASVAIDIDEREDEDEYKNKHLGSDSEEI